MNINGTFVLHHADFQLYKCCPCLLVTAVTDIDISNYLGTNYLRVATKRVSLADGNVKRFGYSSLLKSANTPFIPFFITLTLLLFYR